MSSLAHTDPILERQLAELAELSDPEWGDPEDWTDWTDEFTWEPGPAPFEPTAEDLEDYRAWAQAYEARMAAERMEDEAYTRWLDHLERLDSLRREDDARCEADQYRRHGI
jgi:hypothetical protein